MAQILLLDGAETIGGTKLLLIDEDVRLPRRLVPIHTLKPELFADVLPDERVLRARNGEVVEL